MENILSYYREKLELLDQKLEILLNSGNKHLANELIAARREADNWRYTAWLNSPYPKSNYSNYRKERPFPWEIKES